MLAIATVFDGLMLKNKAVRFLLLLGVLFLVMAVRAVTGGPSSAAPKAPRTPPVVKPTPAEEAAFLSMIDDVMYLANQPKTGMNYANGPGYVLKGSMEFGNLPVMVLVVDRTKWEEQLVVFRLQLANLAFERDQHRHYHHVIIKDQAGNVLARTELRRMVLTQQ